MSDMSNTSEPGWWKPAAGSGGHHLISGHTETDGTEGQPPRAIGT